MQSPKVAVISFPGNNCEVESMRALKENGMEAMFFRWNDDRAKLKDVDGYFIPGGFSYEDRGRSGMVAGRDPLMDFLKEEAESGKVIIGNCNGAQILVESGIIPLDDGLRMSLAHNALETESGFTAPGFLSQWVWIKPTCQKDRCATSDWDGAMHLPIAHGEGRFTTKDPQVIEELNKNDQIAFSYCDAEGNVSTDPIVTPNGSMYAIAGICNPAGNVIALMPHPERTDNGHPYFASIKRWIERGKMQTMQKNQKIQMSGDSGMNVPMREASDVEIFIDTIIVNNEERTVEQTARRFAPSLRLKQWKYFSSKKRKPQEILSDIALFNPNKERAYLRINGKLSHWDAQKKSPEPMSSDKSAQIFRGTLLLRRDIPETGSSSVGEGGTTGICYQLNDIEEQNLYTSKLLEVFGNPHSSVIERLKF